MATRELERAYEALDRALGVAEDLPRLFSAAMGAKDVLAHRGVQAGMGRDELSKHHRKLGRCVEGRLAPGPCAASPPS